MDTMRSSVQKAATVSGEAQASQAGGGVAESVQVGPVYEKLGLQVWVFAAVMVVIGIVTVILMLQEFRSESYFYLAFYSIPANTAISIFPHEPVLIYFGKFATLWLAALAATVGTVVAGYMDHRVFVPVLNLRSLQGYKQKALYRAAISAFMRYPFVTLVITGFSPIPFFPFKFLTFSIHYPLWRYLAALVAARFPRYLALGWIGAEFQIPNWILFGSFLLLIGLYALKALQETISRLRARRT